MNSERVNERQLRALLMNTVTEISKMSPCLLTNHNL